MDARFYTDVLYPLQDQVLGLVDRIDTGFYLSGGTAASRGYLKHRFSDDLDLFVNDSTEFGLWAGRIIHAISSHRSWQVSVHLREERFVRLVVAAESADLKLEMVNDVPARCGEIRRHAVLGRLDSPENILANKVTAALDREEPKDLADIWGFCRLGKLSLAEAIRGAESKAAGVFPADLARLLCSVDRADYDLVRWQVAPGFDTYRRDLLELGETLLLP